MGWSSWRSCPSGHGKISTKTTRGGGKTHHHTLRTASRTYNGSKANHAHTWISRGSSGRSTGHGRGFKKSR